MNVYKIANNAEVGENSIKMKLSFKFHVLSICKCSAA